MSIIRIKLHFKWIVHKMCIPITFNSLFIWSISRKLEILLETSTSLKRIMIKILLIRLAKYYNSDNKQIKSI
jgi:hypothetical protein